MNNKNLWKIIGITGAIGTGFYLYNKSIMDKVTIIDANGDGKKELFLTPVQKEQIRKLLASNSIAIGETADGKIVLFSKNIITLDGGIIISGLNIPNTRGVHVIDEEVAENYWNGLWGNAPTKGAAQSLKSRAPETAGKEQLFYPASLYNPLVNNFRASTRWFQSGKRNWKIKHGYKEFLLSFCIDGGITVDLRQDGIVLSTTTSDINKGDSQWFDRHAKPLTKNTRFDIYVKNSKGKMVKGFPSIFVFVVK